MVSVRFSSRAAALVAGAAIVVAAVIAIGVLRAPAAYASNLDVVSLADGSAVHLATPAFLTVGKRYAFTWPGGGPPQTFVIKAKRADGWVLVEVADENTRPELYIPGEFPTRWLHAALAVSIQEMRALP
jgi:hypothetical protein